MTQRETSDRNTAEETIIRQKITNYIDAWYQGDADIGKKSLHPALAKRIALTDSASGKQYLDEMGAEKLADRWQSGDGKATPQDKRQVDITLLDMHGDMASARLETSGWVDYMHLVKFDGNWVIVNILWERKKQSG